MKTIATIPRAEYLAKHRTYRTLWHTIATGRRVLEPVVIWPEAAMLDSGDESKPITPHQRDSWSKATSSVVGILGGSPGCGKTFLVAAGINALLKSGIVGVNDIGIGAPTGKAAVRLTEQLHAAGLTQLRARTWHSILGLGKGSQDFAHHKGNPLPFRVLVSDESSMLDTNLMRAIFAARPRGCHLLLVGDVNQLPPVGHGAPLRDLIAAGLPYGELTEIKRNSGGIVEACAAIRDGRSWTTGDNLKLIQAQGGKDILNAVVAIVHRVAQSDIDPIWDVQVLVAVNEKSKVGRKAVNKAMQDELNPDGRSLPGCLFRVGDKVVCLKNSWFRSAAGGWEPGAEKSDAESGDDIYVANGELGEVIDVQPGTMTVKLQTSGRTVIVPRAVSARSVDDNAGSESNEGDESENSSSAGCSWDLGYALSVHKAQGSEVPIAVVVLDDYPGAKRLCDRAWLYTAISRAKQKCVLVGMKHTADGMCRKVNLGERKTFLRELVLRGLAERVIGDL